MLVKRSPRRMRCDVQFKPRGLNGTLAVLVLGDVQEDVLPHGIARGNLDRLVFGARLGASDQVLAS